MVDDDGVVACCGVNHNLVTEQDIEREIQYVKTHPDLRPGHFLYVQVTGRSSSNGVHGFFALYEIINHLAPALPVYAHHIFASLLLQRVHHKNALCTLFPCVSKSCDCSGILEEKCHSIPYIYVLQRVTLMNNITGHVSKWSDHIVAPSSKRHKYHVEYTVLTTALQPFLLDALARIVAEYAAVFEDGWQLLEEHNREE